MKNRICNEVEELINLIYPDVFYVVNYDYYLWVYKLKDNRLSLVIHGGVDDDYEVILISADDDKNVSVRFNNKKKLLSYLGKNLLDEMMMYEI